MRPVRRLRKARRGAEQRQPLDPRGFNRRDVQRQFRTQ